MKLHKRSSVLISLGAAAYMIYVFIDLTFLSAVQEGGEQSLVDKFFPVVFLVVGLYMLRAAWEQYKIGHNENQAEQLAADGESLPDKDDIDAK